MILVDTSWVNLFHLLNPFSADCRTVPALIQRDICGIAEFQVVLVWCGMRPMGEWIA